MSSDDGDVVIQTGVYLYAGTAPTQVRIVRQEVTPGSGDIEDPPEIREDREVPCFVIQWGSPGEAGVSRAASGPHATLEEAVRAAEGLVSGIAWKPSG
jgi:hypothetical protein